MSKAESALSLTRIEQRILLMRGQKTILDTDLANLYGVATKRLNEQVKRNQARFPAEFMFQLTKEEKQQVVANCDHLTNLKFSRTNPYAFTELGVIMAANVLNSEQAIEVSLLIVRTFVKLRQMLSSHQKLRQKVEELEEKYDEQFQIIFKVIKQLMDPEIERNERSIGFAPWDIKKTKEPV